VKVWETLFKRSERFEMDMPGASVLMSAFGQPDNERILPGFYNAAQAYGSSAVVFGVILTRLQTFSEAEFKFQRLADKSLFGNADLAKLEDPWPGGSTGELLARMEQDVSLAGNAYIRDTGSQLERLRPDWVTICSEIVIDPKTDTEVRQVIGYQYCPPSSEHREDAFYPVEEVAHWSPIPDPLASFRGMSWLTPVLREVDADAQMVDYKRAYLTNAATPNMIIKYTAKVGDEKLGRLREQITARHGGVGNAFRTLILDEGADVTPVGSSFEAMTFTAVQAAGENRIAVAAGVPAIVVGLKEGLDAAGWSVYTNAMRRFIDVTMRPNWRTACAALAKLVNVPPDAKLWFDTSNISALQEGEKERADTMQVIATAASTFITAGYTPDSILAALAASDVTLLQHSGLVSVQLQAPGTQAPSIPVQGGAA
jgi:phage portal protein BeeE